MENNEITNTYNFFEINEQNVMFWGLNILSKSIPLTKNILSLIRKLHLPYGEVVEIYEDDTFEFFEKAYYVYC